MSWQNRIVRYGSEAPDQLLANPLNPRRHDRYQQRAMEALLREVGFVQDVIVNERTGTLIDGHMRVMLAMRANVPTVPVKYVDLSPEEEAAAIATLDATTKLADADGEAFEALLREISTGEEALQEMLARLAARGGHMGDDRAAGDDYDTGRGPSRIWWGNRELLLSVEERELIESLMAEYRSAHGHLRGFVDWLLKRKGR